MPEHKEYLDFISNYPSLLAIGKTPLVQVDLPLDIGEAEIHAKYEHLNPGGSIKDRPVLRMLVEAILSGDLSEGKVILDATSGNAGIAYSMIGAALGYKVELVMPSNASEERKKRILSHGAKIVFTDPMLGYDETIREVRKKFNQDPNKYFYCDQYGNPNNTLAHYDGTAEEIIRQTENITHFIAGVGTSGTITGIGKRLKEVYPNVKIVLINFDEWPGVEGLKPIGQGHIVPDIFDEDIIDMMIRIDVNSAYQMSKLLASNGIFAGQSSGAYMQGAYQIANESRNSRIITIFNDIGERYFSTGMWD